MYEYYATLIRVIDGDTVVLNLDRGFYDARIARPYRLLRINAPELKETGGLAARDALAAFLAGKLLIAQTQKPDGFGRWLMELSADGKNASDWLVEEGHAVYQEYR